MHLMSPDKSDLLDDESDDDRSEYGSTGTYTFLFPFDAPIGWASGVDHIGRVSGMVSGIFFPIGVVPNWYVVTLVVFILI